MDCKNVQSAIDTGLRREAANETVSAHLSGCQDCRRHSDETAVLLTLLGAQPRIEAPADFDFKLRARLARAKSEPDRAGGLFERLQAKAFSLSWGQTAAATITLAVVVTGSALHFSKSSPGVQSQMSETNYPAVERVAAVVSPPSTDGSAMIGRPSHSVKSIRRNTGYTQASAAVRTNHPNLNSGESGEEVKTEGSDYTWRGFDPQKGKIITTRNRDLIGAENSASTMSKTLSFVPSI